jgi:hypothetical protein
VAQLWPSSSLSVVNHWMLDCADVPRALPCS